MKTSSIATRLFHVLRDIERPPVDQPVPTNNILEIANRMIIGEIIEEKNK